MKNNPKKNQQTTCRAPSPGVRTKIRREMEERPILLGGALVRATLAGNKTHTRRIAKCFDAPIFKTPKWANFRYDGTSHEDDAEQGLHYVERLDAHGEPTEAYYCVGRCPYGAGGDRLWVRETWCEMYGSYFFQADCSPDAEQLMEPSGTVWRPSIHMPRAASRITLEITGVRLERLQDITEEDAIAEGIEPIRPIRAFGWRDYQGSAGFMDPIQSFRSLWDSIYAKQDGRAWADNPWVWVVEFKKIKGA